MPPRESRTDRGRFYCEPARARETVCEPVIYAALCACMYVRLARIEIMVLKSDGLHLTNDSSPD